MWSRFIHPAPFLCISFRAVRTEVSEAKNQLVYYHAVGTDQSEDVLIYSDQDHPEHMFSIEVSDCGSYAILSIGESCDPANKLYVAPLDDFPRTRRL